MALRRIIYALVFYTGSSVYVLLGALMAFINKELLARIAENWSWFQHRCMANIGGVTVRIEGTLPREPFLYAIKHESYFETIDMPRLFNRPAVIAKGELLKIPFWGVVASRYGLIGIDRAGGAKELRALMKTARAMSAAGRPIVIFPEGTRAIPGEAAPLRSGFAGLYKLLNIPVVPIAVDSLSHVDRNGLPVRKGAITYLIGETIPPGLPREEAEARVHAAINALARPSAAPDAAAEAARA